jgi:hypothetical protein
MPEHPDPSCQTNSFELIDALVMLREVRVVPGGSVSLSEDFVRALLARPIDATTLDEITVILDRINCRGRDTLVLRLAAHVRPPPTWLGHWGFLAYLLSRKARREVFEPAWQELLEDYVIACGQYQASWQRRGLNAIFTWRAVCLVWQCLRAVVGDRAVQFLERLAPQLVRWWLTR